MLSPQQPQTTPPETTRPTPPRTGHLAPPSTGQERFSFTALTVPPLDWPSQSELVRTVESDQTKGAERSASLLLRHIASHLPREDRRSYYLDESRTHRELLSVLKETSQREIKLFLKSMYKLSEGRPEVQDYLARKTNNAALHLESGELKLLIEEILAEKDSQAKGEFTYHLLRSVVQTPSLYVLIDDIGRDKLHSLQHKDIDRLIAKTVSGFETILNIGLPKTVDELLDRMDDAKTLLLSSPYAETLEAKRIKSILSYNELFIETRLRDQSYKGNLYEIVAFKLFFELEGGILLMDEADMGKGGARWSESDLNEVIGALMHLPRGVLMTSDNLFLIVRATTGEGDLHLGSYDGRKIYIYDSASKMNLVAETFLHEVGHALSKRHSERKFDYPDFQNLSWHSFADARYSFKENLRGTTTSVVLDGRHFPIDKPVQYQGETVVFMKGRYDGKLYARRYEDYFDGRYAESDPAEDYAESFKSYFGFGQGVRDPKRARGDEKLRFFEEEFGLGRESEARLKLEKARERYKAVSSEHESEHREAPIERERQRERGWRLLGLAGITASIPFLKRRK